MLILPRYIIKEHIGPFFIGLSVILFIVLTNFIAQNFGLLIGKGLKPILILELIYLNLAWIIVLTVPMSVLISTLMTFGKLSGDNEIIAMKSCGVNFYTMIAPVLIMVGFIAYGCVIFNNMVLPDANHKARLLMSDIWRKKPSLSFEEGIFSEKDVIENYRILIKKIDKESTWIYNITIFDRSEPNLMRTIIAERGTMVFAEEKEVLILTLFNGEVHEVDMNDLENYMKMGFERNRFQIPVSNMQLKRSFEGARGDREMSAGMMMKEVNNEKTAMEKNKIEFVKIFKQKLNIDLKKVDPVIKYIMKKNYIERTDIEMFVADHNRKESSEEEIQEIADSYEKNKGLFQLIMSQVNMIENSQRYISGLMVEVHKKYSIPVACIVFVFVGAPLGVMARSAGIGVSGGLSILFFLFYWSFLIGGEELANRMIITPFWSMWSANIIVGIIGIYLTIVTVKETTLIDFNRLKKIVPKNTGR